MSTAPEVNPYAPMGATSEGGEPRRPPRWFALLVSLLSGPFAGAGLLVLGRPRLALITIPLCLLACACWLFPIAPALVGVAAVAIIALWLAGIIVTAAARPGRFPGWGKSLALLATLLVMSNVGSALAKNYLTEAFRIPSGAMIPTLLVGDQILVDKGAGRLPARGDVIVFGYPRDPGTDYIKRVVGLPGETVSFRRGEVLIDGKPLRRWPLDEASAGERGPYDLFEESTGERSYRIMQRRERTARFESEPFRVPANGVFVLGDNRDDSNDSRVWGAVPLALIKGRARTVWFSKAPDGDIRWERCGIPIR